MGAGRSISVGAYGVLSAVALAGACSSSHADIATPGPGGQVTVVTQPSAAPGSGLVFPVQPTAQLRFTSGAVDAEPGVVITVAISSGGGTLGGTTTATTDATGTAAFTDLSIAGIAGARTLTFSAVNFYSGTSATINLGAGRATQLVIVTQPSSQAASAFILPQQPIIQLVDAYGNAVHQAGYIVTAALGPGTGALGGVTSTMTDSNGVATFTNLAITAPPDTPSARRAPPPRFGLAAPTSPRTTQSTQYTARR